MSEDMKNDFEVMHNSFTELAGIAGAFGANPFGAQLSKTDSMRFNLRYNLISNDRNLLSQSYVEHGLIQTLIDQPVDDAYRAGFEIKTNELDGEELEELEIYCEESGLIRGLTQALKWARLFGGAGVLIISEQDPAKPFDINKVKPDSKIEYRAVDLWELFHEGQKLEGSDDFNEGSEFYNYYGRKVHNSHILRILGKEPPSFVRPRLRGWGMSEVEKVVRSISQYFKNQDVVFELLDEAKIDVYRLEGLNAALSNENGAAKTAQRLQAVNQLKNYNNALTMDKDDEYEQKNITFAGLADMLTQIRQGIAGDLKIPMTKLFGLSAAGFNSGEDDIENYNAMIETEIRSKSKFLLVRLLKIGTQKVFGHIPQDLMVVYPPLRMLSAKEEEEVKNAKFNRTISTYQTGLADARATKESLNKESLLPVELDENSSVDAPIGEDFTITESLGDAE